MYDVTNQFFRNFRVSNESLLGSLDLSLPRQKTTVTTIFFAIFSVSSKIRSHVRYTRVGHHEGIGLNLVHWLKSKQHHGFPYKEWSGSDEETGRRFFLSYPFLSYIFASIPSAQLEKKNVNSRENTISSCSVGTRKHPILFECGSSVKYERGSALPVKMLENQFDKGGDRRYHGVVGPVLMAFRDPAECQNRLKNQANCHPTSTAFL
ncbi:hypothetical protein Y032_0001g276 [Ancylostoma ceylanicum]|uniref:Uncharacterized protein n=1 Tax=Ancylostoma ceylanicum TaxID=53326 RepID=A0A016W582_9BILA|nr:hypothetical protein Y032_0001g276 [Ancylostoma ceylanicum]